VRARHAQFLSGGPRGELLGAMRGEQMTKEGGWKTFEQLRFFIGERMPDGGGFIALERIPAGASRATVAAARPAVYPASGSAQVASPQNPILC